MARVVDDDDDDDDDDDCPGFTRLCCLALDVRLTVFGDRRRSVDAAGCARFSKDEQNGVELLNGVRRALQQTEDSDPSSIFDSVFMSLSDTLNSINTLESSDQTPEDIPQNTSKRTPLASDITR